MLILVLLGIRLPKTYKGEPTLNIFCCCVKLRNGPIWRKHNQVTKIHQPLLDYFKQGPIFKRRQFMGTHLIGLLHKDRMKYFLHVQKFKF